MSGAVTASAHAQLNLHLQVGRIGVSGYHDTLALTQAVTAHETITLTPASAYSVEVRGPFADTTIPLDASNYALAAVLSFAHRTGYTQPVRVTLTKNVPVAGGLGGGAADAAAALRAIAHLADFHAEDVLVELAAGLGAAVPFALRGGTVLVRGHGGPMTPVISQGPFDWVFAASAQRLSTATVYRHLDAMRSAGHICGHPPDTESSLGADPHAVLKALAQGDSASLANSLHNDLTDATLSMLPGVALVREAGLRAGALAAVVCGTGPTVAFLARDYTHALELAVLLSASRGVREVVRAQSPAGAARVLPWRSAVTEN